MRLLNISVLTAATSRLPAALLKIQAVWFLGRPSNPSVRLTKSVWSSVRCLLGGRIKRPHFQLDVLEIGAFTRSLAGPATSLHHPRMRRDLWVEEIVVGFKLVTSTCKSCPTFSYMEDFLRRFKKCP